MSGIARTHTNSSNTPSLTVARSGYARLQVVRGSQRRPVDGATNQVQHGSHDEQNTDDGRGPSVLVPLCPAAHPDPLRGEADRECDPVMGVALHKEQHTDVCLGRGERPHHPVRSDRPPEGHRWPGVSYLRLGPVQLVRKRLPVRLGGQASGHSWAFSSLTGARRSASVQRLARHSGMGTLTDANSAEGSARSACHNGIARGA